MWDSHNRGFLIAASAGSTKASKELLEEMGLIGYHSYGVLDIALVGEHEKEEKLVKL